MNTSFRRFFRYFDWLNLGFTLLLACIGLLAVYSATFKPELPYSFFFKKQCLGITIGLLIYMLGSLIDYRSVARWGFYAYIGIIGLLIITIIKGSIGMGARRWINLFFFKIQPSEFVKLVFPAFFGYFFQTLDPKQIPTQLIVFISAVLVTTTVLILKQPDLGTAIILLICGFLLFWLAGVSYKFFVVVGVSALLILPLGWHMLHPYQKKRIEVFLGQGSSHLERYQIEQSIIAIGSGGWWGKGFLQGTQNKLHFLPEGRTDFIFAVICEEWGFIGAATILLLFSFLFARLFFVITTIKSYLAYIFACGLMLPLIISMLINIGMVMGLLPIVGIPLPLMSYGLCHLWITFASLGILNNISIRRFYH